MRMRPKVGCNEASPMNPPVSSLLADSVDDDVEKTYLLDFINSYYK